MRALFVVPSDYDSLVRKGVAHTIAARDEGGFLSRVITVHPFALVDREIVISESGQLVEFRQPPSARLRFWSWVRSARHLARVIFRTYRAARREKVDFVRAQDPYLSGLIGYVVARSMRRPFCISLHADYDKMHELDPAGGAPKIFGSRRLSRGLETWLLGRADLVLPITGYMARYAAARGANPARVRIFRHIVDMCAFAPTDDDFVGGRVKRDGAPIIGVVSRLSRQKYIFDAIEIASSLGDLGIDFVMEIAGDGEERSALGRRIAAEGLGERVRLLGFLDGAGLARLHRRSSIHLSLICGASLIEACAAGVCVVGYDVEWQSELIRTNDTGVLVPAGDSGTAAQAVASLLRAPETRHRLGAGARSAALAMFDPEKLRRAHRDIYRELVATAAA